MKRTKKVWTAPLILSQVCGSEATFGGSVLGSGLLMMGSGLLTHFGS